MFRASIRAKIYNLLSNVFLEPPSIKFFNSLRNMLLSGDGCLLQSDPIANSLTPIRLFLRETEDRNTEDVVKELSAEFTYLFRGIRVQCPPPYESVFREGLVYGASTRKVLTYYKLFCVSLGESYRTEPPDHISFELDFMKLLCEKEAEAWLKNDRERLRLLLQTQKKFLDEHLMIWIEAFCENIEREDKLGFYKGWANFTSSWILMDKLHIHELLITLSECL